MNYVNLHTHSYYSVLDGLSSPEEYMVRANELGMSHLAITDHGTPFAHREWQSAAKSAGIIPILGLEGYISSTDRFDNRSSAKREDGTSVYNHITLLAQDSTGIKTLNRLSEIAWTEGFYHKPRMDTELLFSDNEGIIVLSGCMSGLVAKSIENGDLFTAKRYAQQYRDALGDRFFIEVMSSNDPALNHALLSIADEFGIKPVMTTDCHYANKEDLWIEEAMLILSTNPKVDFTADLAKSKKMDILERLNYLYPDRRMTFEKIEIYLRSYETEVAAFTKQGIDRTDIYENTLEIASRVGEYPFYQGLDLLPKTVGEDPNVKLRRRVEKGLVEKGVSNDPVYTERADEELAIIEITGSADYLLIAEDLVSWARSMDIPVGPGRGSSVGSVVNWALKITMPDPVKHGLLFFRFLDPARDDKPDIDFDFGDTRRGEVKSYATRKYKHAASLATYNTFGGKYSLKDASRVFRIPLAEVNRATKNNDAPPDAYYFDYFDVSEKGREFTKVHPEAVDLAKRLYGRLRGYGMHPAAVVLSEQPISNYAPMETAKDPNDKAGPRISMVAMDMNQAADIGLIKLDFLGLKAMTVIDDTVKSIEKRHGKVIDLMEIDLEDKNVYAMLSEGFTKGVFQVEADAYTGLILEMGGLTNFNELVASNALVRPGAKKTIGAEYIARKNGKMTEYVHKDVQWFTKETYGEVLYQEQVMLMMTELAGMSMSDANKVRSIIGKKKNPAEFEKFKEAWLEGASKKIKKKVAEKLWKDFEAHAGYSFNKSHAVAYSMASYWTAWLKYHYPIEFMAATLFNEGEKESITDYLIESKRLGIKVLLPHINKSGRGIEIQNDCLRLGLTNVKFIQEKTANAFMERRPYANYKELLDISSAKGSGMNARALGALNAIGAACFEDNPKTGRERDNFYEYLQIPSFEVKDLHPKVKFMFKPLDEFDERGTFAVLGMVRKVVRKDGWARIEVVDETGNAGIFVDPKSQIEAGQMYAMLVAKNRVLRYMTMDELVEKIPNEFTSYLYNEIPQIYEGYYRVMSNKLYVTKAGKKMSHMVLIDSAGELMFVMAFPQEYKQAYLKCREGAVVDLELGQTDDGSHFLKEIK